MAEKFSRSRNRGGVHSVINHEVFHYMPTDHNHHTEIITNETGLDPKMDMTNELTVVGLRNPIPAGGTTTNGARPGNFIQPFEQKPPSNGAQSKTPVSILQETLSRKGLTPKYELLQEEGAIHEPTFRYRVTVADIIATGTGRSKKEAKHSAAKSILDKLKGTAEQFAIPEPPKKEPTDENLENPIGQLQELCMSRRWPPPGYLTEREEGLPHERQFTIACQVFRYKEMGTGKSKKVAKRLAAQKMLTYLQGVPCEDNNSFGLDDEDELVQRITNTDLGDMKGRNVSQSFKVAQFHKNLRNSKGAKLKELQIMNLCDSQLDAIKTLNEIAAEQNFNVTFVDIEEKSVSGKCQCLVQLSTLPVAVCSGSGKTIKEAQIIAAFTALSYLRHMTRSTENQTNNSTPAKM